MKKTKQTQIWKTKIECKNVRKTHAFFLPPFFPLEILLFLLPNTTR